MISDMVKGSAFVAAFSKCQNLHRVEEVFGCIQRH